MDTTRATIEALTRDPASDAMSPADWDAVRLLVSRGERVTDPGLRLRLDAWNEASRRRMCLEHGETDLAVALIREFRDR